MSQLVSNAQTNLTADAIMRKAVARAEQGQGAIAQPAYTYNKFTLTEELDAGGRVKERKARVYQVFFQAGSSNVKLLEVNGRPPGAADLKMQSEKEENVRQLLAHSRSAHSGNGENFLTAELTARFDFKMLGQTNLSGRSSFQLAFEPKRPAPPVHRLVDRFLDRISGVVWIDSEEYEIARADIYLSSEVDLLGGVVGCLKKLAYSVIRTRVADGVWFNSSSAGEFEGRKLLDEKRIKIQSHSANFRPLADAS